MQCPTTVQTPPGNPRPVSQRSAPAPMSDVERLASFVGGAALACYGLRRSLGHLVLVAGGSALIYHAFKGKRLALRDVGAPDRQSGDRPQR
jgi:uncharacterized membrane protein